MSSEFQLFCIAKCKNGEQCTSKALEKYDYKLCGKHKKYSKEIKKPETRKAISKKDRLDVWNFYIGAAYGLHQCLLCCAKILDKGSSDWHCGHVISHADGGSSSVSNLRPICTDCNYAMGKTDMKVYAAERDAPGERYCTTKDKSAIVRLQLTGEPLINKSLVETNVIETKSPDVSTEISKLRTRLKYYEDSSILAETMIFLKTAEIDAKVEEIKRLKTENADLVSKIKDLSITKPNESTNLLYHMGLGIHSMFERYIRKS